MVVGNQRKHELDSYYLDIYIINKTISVPLKLGRIKN